LSRQLCLGLVERREQRGTDRRLFAVGEATAALIDATVLPPPSHRILQAEHREQPLRHTELRGRACIQPEQRAAEAGRQLPLLQLLLVHTPVLRAERAAKRNRQPKVV